VTGRWAVAGGAVALTLVLACRGSGNGSGPYASFNPGPTPPELRRGEAVFNTFCMSCHGRHGRGEGLGPALLDPRLGATRLSEDAFYRAIEQGIPQTHYHYGAMPAVKPVKRMDATQVYHYVRWLQARAAESGITDSARAGAP
jgi:mono/diheme cytochrome c family protein